MKNRKRIIILVYILFTTSSHVFSQDNKFKLSLGLSGTGTFDEGLWYFKESRGLGPQEFKFSNSWGIGLDVEYSLISKITAGIHMSIASTPFSLAIDDGFSTSIIKTHTSHNQLIAELKYIGRPGKAFRPFIGFNAGILFTRDINIPIGSEHIEFAFINPVIYGLVFGIDYAISSSGLFINLSIRGQTFEYTTEETSVTNRQTLLDQVWWMNYNHLQLGLSKTL